MNKYNRLLVFGIILLILPFIVFSIYSYRQLIEKQELQLRRGYEHSAAYILKSQDSAIHEIKHHLIFIGKNPVLQNALSKDVIQSKIPSMLSTSIEPYIWYHITSNRSLLNQIKIYANINQPVGVFLRPLQDLDESIINDTDGGLNEGKLINIDGKLCFAYRFYKGLESKPLGIIVGCIDVDNLVKNSVQEDKEVGISMLFNGKILYQSNKSMEGPTVKITKNSTFDGLSLYMQIPSKNIRLQTTPLLFATIISLVLLLAIYAVLAWSIRRLELQVESERNKQERMRLKAIQAQINPHFLYNTLSMINWKAKYANIPDISKITTLISDFYRTALNKGEEKITISEELKNIKSYLELKSIMMDNCFTYSIECEKELENELILNFILQPIVENALLHGIAPRGEGHVAISVRSVGEDIIFNVIDDGQGMSNSNTISNKASGYGIENINERIKLICGERYGVYIPVVQNGCLVEIRVKKISS